MQLGGIAQKKADLKNADGFYRQGDYYNAIVNYEVYIGIRKPITTFSPYTLKRKNVAASADSGLAAINTINTSNAITQNIAWQLGESYRQLYHYQRAEACYAKLLSLGSDANYPLAHYWYAVCLRSNKKFDAAEKQVKLFLQENKNNKINNDLGNKELATLAFIKQQIQQADKSLSFNKLKGNVGQTEGAYAPIVFNDTLLFTSARIVDTVSKYSTVNEHVNHLFYNTIANDNTVAGNATRLHFPSRLSQNEGTASLTPDKKRLYFARSSEENGKTFSSIYVSKRLDANTWSEPTKLDDKINKPGYTSIQPSVTQDNKYFLFASDREGGIGKFDIWCSPIDASGNLGEPFNLKSINTKEDDEAPFYHINSQTLVFASKGYLGLGGFDLYAAKGDILHLQVPVNLGYPTNSPKDDIYFFSTSSDSLLKKSFVSSDRASDCCLELFAVNKIYPIKHYQSISGIVSDCDGNMPLDAVSVSVSNTPNNYAMATNKKGTFIVAVADSVTGFDVSKDGFVTKSVPFAVAKTIVNDTVYKVSICLEKVPPPVIKAIDSVNISNKPLIVYFDFDKSDIKEQYDTVLDQVVALLNQYPTISLELQINGYTDSRGTDEYNLKLGQRRAEACQQYIIGKGVDASRLTLKSFGKAAPVASNTTPDNKDNPEGRALNRRVEINIKAQKSK
jgi:outer membrane protein OmpA-like peptidoglycan-associated protein/tetratricopeptide (TPR) repeat protein